MYANCIKVFYSVQWSVSKCVGKCFESVQSRAEVYVLKACDACADMGQL